MMIRHIAPVISFLFILFSNPLFAQEATKYWPKQMEVDGIVITIYAPEPEEFENNMLNARAAFSIFDKVHLPVFGAMWFSCQVHTNVKTNEVYFTDIRLENASFPNADANSIGELQLLIESQAQNWHFNSNLQYFYSAVEVVNINNEFNEQLNNVPPKIIYTKQPTILVYIDGEPKLANIGGSELYQFVVNTPHFIIRSSSDRQYYLKAGSWWFVTSDPNGSWKAIETPPNQVARLAEKAVEVDPNRTKSYNQIGGRQPKLIVTGEQAELIQTNGEPEMKQIYENLFSVSNSDDEIIFDSYSDHYYILISGRWYKTNNLEHGRWSFVAPGSMPEVFSKIPSNSPFAHVRLSIQGTPEALSAALNNGIPQTAVVDRLKAKMFVEYDGDPKFEPIQGTSLSYAINTGGSIIETADGQYFAVDQAVWFTAKKPQGPWIVADHYPDDVRKIPPSCPVFNMKFVHVYDADEEIVFVGYTAGYLGAFLYKGVVYYGTGYKYKSWFGDKYIPRPNTYGYGAKKKSAGASSNIQFSAAAGMGGPMMGVGFGGYPYGYGYGYGMGFGYGGYYGYGMWNQMAYNQYYYAGQKIMVDQDVVEKKPIDLENLYNNRAEGIVITETARKNDPMKPIILKDREAVPNELYVDQDGTLYRQDDQGRWFEQTTGGWRQTEKTINK
jgi:hypothetical protein